MAVHPVHGGCTISIADGQRLEVEAREVGPQRPYDRDDRSATPNRVPMTERFMSCLPFWVYILNLGP